MMRLASVRVPPSIRHVLSSSIRYNANTPETPIIPTSINEVLSLIFPVSRIAAMVLSSCFNVKDGKITGLSMKSIL
jgi:hypothetical protein